MTRIERLQKACAKVGLYVATYTPGTGVRHYRFFTEPSGYFGPKNGIYTADGYKAACEYARSRSAPI